MRHHLMVSTSREANDSDAREENGTRAVRRSWSRAADVDARARPAGFRGWQPDGGRGGSPCHDAAPGWARAAFRSRLRRAARAILTGRVGVVMAGEATEPRITTEDVFQVARCGSRVWRLGRGGRTWRLTRDDLLAIDQGWDGDLDDLSPMVAQAVAAALNREKPWLRADDIRGDAEEDLDGVLAWADGIDTTRASASRVYDCLLGGSHNFAADRDLAEKLLSLDPRAGEYARANRAFLHRAVRFLLGTGVRQFLDLGSGVPTAGSVHEIAGRHAPEARVVYVDIDPIAVAHSRQILADNPHATAVEIDLRRPEVICSHPEIRQVLDLAAPVGLLMVAVLHFVGDDDDPAGILARYRRQLAAGSYLVISHACPPETASTVGEAARDSYAATATPLTLRSREQVATLLAGWHLVSPGLVEVSCWRPEDSNPQATVPGVAAVARSVEVGESPGGEPGGSDV